MSAKLAIEEELLRKIIDEGVIGYFSEKAIKEFDFSDDFSFDITDEHGEIVYFNEIRVSFPERSTR